MHISGISVREAILADDLGNFNGVAERVKRS